MKRKVIIHKHLFKNAGTTFDWSLKQNFGDAFYDHRDDRPMQKGGQPYLIQFLKGNPHIKALSSHHVWFRFQPDDEIELIPVYLIRHPIERIRSVYNFERIQKSNTLGAKMAKKLKFCEYVEWRMDKSIPGIIRNYQTRMLSGANTGKAIEEHHLKWAIEEINNNDFIGIVDRYEESMLKFELKFAKININLDLSYKVQNALQPTKEINIKERVDKILFELGSMADEVIANNQYDLHIYNLLNKQP